MLLCSALFTLSSKGNSFNWLKYFNQLIESNHVEFNLDMNLNVLLKPLISLFRRKIIKKKPQTKQVVL